MTSAPRPVPLKVLVWSINYAPEPTGIAPYNVALCRFLRERGHDARMLTAFPYYPDWKKLPGDRGQLFRDDTVDGVPVHRCWHYVPARVTTPRRMLHEASFVATSLLRALTLRPPPDVVVVVSPPLLLGAAAWVFGWRRGRGRIPYVFHVQDLQPDAAVGLGMVRPGRFSRALYGLESFTYRHAARVSGISGGMLRAFAQKGIPPARRVFFPNGITFPDPAGLPPPGRWRARHGFAPEDFLAVYSGNLGRKQGFDGLLEAAGRVRAARLRIILCGGGTQRAQLARAVEQQGAANLLLLPLQDDEAYREMMVDTDLSLITQQAGTGQFFFPSKLLSALSFARPVLAVADADSELAHAVTEGGFGTVVPPGDSDGLAEELDRFTARPVEALGKLGRAGRRYGQRFEQERVLGEFENVLRAIVELR